MNEPNVISSFSEPPQHIDYLKDLYSSLNWSCMNSYLNSSSFLLSFTELSLCACVRDNSINRILRKSGTSSFFPFIWTYHKYLPEFQTFYSYKQFHSIGSVPLVQQNMVYSFPGRRFWTPLPWEYRQHIYLQPKVRAKLKHIREFP